MDGNTSHAKQETGTFNWDLRHPFLGVENSENQAGDLAARVVNLLVPELQWITGIVREQLELGLDDYAVYISGTPVRIARLGSEAIGYSIHVSIHPRFAPQSGPAATELVGRA
jgi:hypothetical protein